jgi:hypothetical protein
VRGGVGGEDTEGRERPTRGKGEGGGGEGCDETAGFGDEEGARCVILSGKEKTWEE